MAHKQKPDANSRGMVEINPRDGNPCEGGAREARRLKDAERFVRSEKLHVLKTGSSGSCDG